MYPWKISTSARMREKEYPAKQRILFSSSSSIVPSFALPSCFLDFLPVWPRLNYRKPCFGCHGRIPISRRVARVAGTSYGVSRILYEFLSWNDSFICLSSIPSPPPPPRAPLPSLARPSLTPSLRLRLRHRRRLATGIAESLSIPICLSFHLTESQTWREPSVGDRTAGLAGRQSQLRSWFKVGARTKYTPPVIRLVHV